jgi:hypothetical protein
MPQATLGSNPTIRTGTTAPLQYLTCMVGSMTFENEKIRTVVTEHMDGRTLNACAGETVLGAEHNSPVHRNDIEADRPQLDTVCDVYDLADEYPEGYFETVLYDPPWTTNQGEVTYGTGFPGYTEELMEIFDHLLVDDGKIITVGYTTSVGILSNPELPYDRTATAIINSFGRMPDPFLTVNERVPESEHTLPVSNRGQVVMNNGVPHNSRPTQDKPFDFYYDYEPTEAAANDAMREFIDEYTRGYTIDIYSVQPTTTYDWVFRNSPPEDAHGDDISIPSHETDVTPHFAFDPTNINRDLSHWGFKTMIFNPPSDKIFLNYGPNGETGLDRLVKEALNPQIKDSGRIIQVGPTTTLMPDDSKMDDGMPYERVAVGLFTHPDATQDTCITVDEVAETQYLSDSTASTRWDGYTPPQGSGPIKYRCIHCGQDWWPSEYPALRDVDCDHCGAHQGESYCLEDHDGTLLPANIRTPREGLHLERENRARTLDSMQCPDHEYGHVVMELSAYAPLIP